MTCIATVRERLQQAEGLPGIFDAAYAAFEGVLTAICDLLDPDAPLFIPLVMAAPHAAGGRDAILFAPSLPPRPLHPGESQRGSGPVTADELARLCELLALKLTQAAALAEWQRDRAACDEASGRARELHGLLMGPHGD
jgi:hypothetical protein